MLPASRSSLPDLHCTVGGVDSLTGSSNHASLVFIYRQSPNQTGPGLCVMPLLSPNFTCSTVMATDCVDAVRRHYRKWPSAPADHVNGARIALSGTDG